MAVRFTYPDKEELVVEGPVGCTDVVSNDDYRFLDVGLPAEVARLKAAGYLEEARAECTHIIDSGVQPELEACLRAERHRMGRLARQFCVTRSQALRTLRAEWPDVSDDDLDRLVRTRRIDWRFIDGEQRFLNNFLDSLRVYPAEVPRLRPDAPYDLARRDAVLARMRDEGSVTCEITLRASIEVPGALPNLRDATVLGLVGAGGYGAPLIFAMNAYRWNEAGAILAGLIILVLAVEFISTRIRVKLARG